ncbi:MAG TPA: cupin domain-containing protein [Janthinobacterium sp.]|jgi:quercetin dioxygenase-like cupin family protein|nr:cupin domain-containing protein [Janthinobacterium sp.]
MALPHAASGAVIDVQRGDEDLSQFSSIALAKTPEQELIRMTLPKGKTLPEHHVPGEVTLLCLQGEVTVETHGASRVLRAGQMLYLHGGQAHALLAGQDSLLLRTILLIKPLTR